VPDIATAKDRTYEVLLESCKMYDTAAVSKTLLKNSTKNVRNFKNLNDRVHYLICINLHSGTLGFDVSCKCKNLNLFLCLTKHHSIKLNPSLN
jgi:hypothetical protein